MEKKMEAKTAQNPQQCSRVDDCVISATRFHKIRDQHRMVVNKGDADCRVQAIRLYCFESLRHYFDLFCFNKTAVLIDPASLNLDGRVDRDNDGAKIVNTVLDRVQVPGRGSVNVRSPEAVGKICPLLPPLSDVGRIKEYVVVARHNEHVFERMNRPEQGNVGQLLDECLGPIEFLICTSLSHVTSQREENGAPWVLLREVGCELVKQCRIIALVWHIPGG
jgi:hypothetical protein